MNRENNYDCLRVVCCLAVVILHVSGQYIGPSTDPYIYIYIYI